MQVSTSAFYAWAKMPDDTDKKIRKKQLEAKAIELFGENKNVYGSRRLSEAFIKEDIQIGRYKARQLMKKLGLKPRYPKRFQVTTDSDHNETIAPNLLNRQFDVAAPNRFGRPILLTSGPLNAGSTSRLLLIYFPCKWWAGPLPITYVPHCVLMPYQWRFGGENLNQAWCIIRIGAANMLAMNTEVI